MNAVVQQFEPLIDAKILRRFAEEAHLAPCEYMEIKSDVCDTDEAAQLLGISVDDLEEYCRLHLVPHARIGRGVRFLKSMLADYSAESLEAARKDEKKKFIQGDRYVKYGGSLEDCKIMAIRHRLPWAGVKRLILSGAITAKQDAKHRWIADEGTFNDECNGLGREAFREGRKAVVPCSATQAERKALLKKQRKKCACCGQKRDKLCVDHDHETGAMREGLCHHCNAGIGHFRDNPERLEKAIAYLRRHGK